MLDRPDVLEHHVTRFLQKVGPMHAVSAIGYDPPSEALADANLARVASAAAWGFVDLRDDDATALERLRQEVGNETLVVATRDPVGTPLSNLIRAHLDGLAAVDLGDGAPIARPRRQSLVVLCEGISDLEGVSTELEAIQYWDFVL
jgi:hypothetical protein